jgi:hypothetical protein
VKGFHHLFTEEGALDVVIFVAFLLVVHCVHLIVIKITEFIKPRDMKASVYQASRSLNPEEFEGARSFKNKNKKKKL